jgi:hypothetical protein
MVCDALIDHDGHMSGSATNSIVRRVWNQAPSSFPTRLFLILRLGSSRLIVAINVAAVSN